MAYKKGSSGGSGEVNTASNVGTGGVGVYKQKSTYDLQFRNINAGSSKLSVTLDATDNEIDLDVVTANITGIAPSAITGTAVVTGDSRLSDARTPTAHTHPQSDITNLVTDLSGKAASVHTHVIADITDIANASVANAVTWNGANKTVSTSAPTGGANGDIWFQYTA